MTTVLAVYNSDGCVGGCDAKCHNRIGLMREDVARFATDHGLEARDLTVVDRVATPSRKRARTVARKQTGPYLPEMYK